MGLITDGTEHLRHPPLPNALCDAGPTPLQLARLHPRVQDTAGGVRQEHLHPALGCLLEVGPRATQGAPRARGTHKGVQLTPRLLKDLRACGLVVRKLVIHVVKLVTVGSGGGVGWGGKVNN